MAEEQTARLLEYAPKMLNLAYSERTFQNDTFNLADSYVWVVYYNGIPQGSGYLDDNYQMMIDTQTQKPISFPDIN